MTSAQLTSRPSSTDRLQVLAHRGWPDPDLHPENTVASVEAALDSGADGVEVDVRLTADGVAVCCHDDDLTRVGVPGVDIRTSSWDELQHVRLPGGFPVPRLVDVATAAAGRGLLVLDLKPEPRAGTLLRASLAALRLAGVPDPDACVSSFDEHLLELLALRRPRMARAAILDVDDPVGPALVRARRRGDAALHLPLRTVLQEPATVREAGIDVRVWTVNRVLDARLCALTGVSGVFTDVPAEVAAGLRPVPA